MKADKRQKKKAKFTDLTPSAKVSTSAFKTLAVFFDAFTDLGLTNIAARHPHLENLFIVSNETLTDDALISILSRELHLRRLGLKSCPLLTDRSLEALGNLCPQLRWLCVGDCRGTTDRGWSSIQETRPLVGYSSDASHFFFFLQCNYERDDSGLCRE